MTKNDNCESCARYPSEKKWTDYIRRVTHIPPLPPALRWLSATSWRDRKKILLLRIAGHWAFVFNGENYAPVAFVDRPVASRINRAVNRRWRAFSLRVTFVPFVTDIGLDNVPLPPLVQLTHAMKCSRRWCVLRLSNPWVPELSFTIYAVSNRRAHEWLD